MSGLFASEEDFSAIEQLLCCAYPKKDMAALTRQLKKSFVTTGALYSANPYLLESCGVHPHMTLLISHLQDMVRHHQRLELVKAKNMGRLELARDYLISNFFALPVEQLYLFCLNSRGRMFRSIMLHEGTQDGMLFSLRRLLSEVISTSPYAIIISHNHPQGTLRPSQEDIDTTMDILEALPAVGVPLVDHIIVARNHAVSMRDNGFIPAQMWLKQHPNNRLLRDWLKPAEPPKSPKRRPLENSGSDR